jgi:hypothetical protein
MTIKITSEILFCCGDDTSCLLLTHGAAPKTASCDLSTLSSPNGDEGKQTNGTEGAQGNQIYDSLVEVAYVCESCGTETKRTIREK